MALPVPAADTANIREHTFRNGTDYPITQCSHHSYSQPAFYAYANTQSHPDTG